MLAHLGQTIIQTPIVQLFVFVLLQLPQFHQVRILETLQEVLLLDPRPRVHRDPEENRNQSEPYIILSAKDG